MTGRKARAPATALDPALDPNDPWTERTDGLWNGSMNQRMCDEGWGLFIHGPRRNIFVIEKWDESDRFAHDRAAREYVVSKIKPGNIYEKAWCIHCTSVLAGAWMRPDDGSNYD